MRYGCHPLRRGDHDGSTQAPVRPPRWGGVDDAAASMCPAAAPNAMPAATPGAVTVPEHVRRLQEDLITVGILIGGAADGAFGRGTEFALREFQAYAKMERVAREDTNLAPAQHPYVTRLAAVETGAQRYQGPVSGVLNAETRAALQHWIANHWRVPVVVEMWRMVNGQRDTRVLENLWAYNRSAGNAGQLRMYARDFSGYYALPAGRHADALVELGRYVTYLSWSGPVTAPTTRTCWPEAEMLPESLVGSELAAMTAAQRSTFKVARAVAEVECYAFFDSINCYDNAFVSLGPCHWTLGIVQGTTVSEGELCGYLAYLAAVEPDAFTAALEFFGVRVDEVWGVDGDALYINGQRKFAGWLALQAEGGGFVRMEEVEAAGNFLKSWHWMYRYLMAGRTNSGFRRRMWDMARIRLRDLRAAARDGSTIGATFTSERSMGILLRWHIRFPGDVIAAANAGQRVRDALDRARAAQPTLAWADRTTWTDAHEAALVQGLRDEVAQRNNAGLSETIDYVDAWPQWATGANPHGYQLDTTIGRLSEARGSFVFAAEGLPPEPP